MGRFRRFVMTGIRDMIDDIADGEKTPVVLFDGLDDALLGCSYISGCYVAVYSHERMVAVFRERDGMDYDGAVEYVDFNILSSLGDGTPIVVFDRGSRDVHTPGC
jgi:hypothetical protein